MAVGPSKTAGLVYIVVTHLNSYARTLAYCLLNLVSTTWMKAEERVFRVISHIA